MAAGASPTCPSGEPLATDRGRSVSSRAPPGLRCPPMPAERRRRGGRQRQRVRRQRAPRDGAPGKPRKKAAARRDAHSRPSVRRGAASSARPAPYAPPSDLIPTGVDTADVRAGGRTVRLTHLLKPFWPARGITKGDLLRYYAAVSS